MPDFDTLSELILYVEDMDRMLTFYRDTLGLEHHTGEPEHGFVKLDVGGSDLCLHAGGERDFGSDAPKFVFEVDDLEAASDHLRAVDDVELGEERSPAPGVRVVDGLDPEGNKFSIEAAGDGH